MTHTDHDPHDPELDALLRRLDHPPPAIRAEDLIARAERQHAQPWRVAAGILLAFAVAGIAYALPGSPLPAWIDAIVTRSDTTPAPQQPTAAAPDGAGIALEVDGPLVIEVRGRTRGAVVRVSIVDGEHLTARAPVGTARFLSEPSRLVIDVLAPDTLHIAIPPRTLRVEITAGTRRIFLKEGSEVSAAAAPDPGGGWLVHLE